MPLTDIVAGPDGNLWFAISRRGGIHLGGGGNPGPVTSKIARITPGGAVTEFAAGIVQGSDPSLGAGPDGNVWFTGADGRVGRITPAGQVNGFTVAPHFGVGNGIVTGPDGSLWFVQRTFRGPVIRVRVGRITPAGAVTRYALGQPVVQDINDRLAPGADGNLWFAATTGGQTASRAWSIRRITPAGVTTEFATGFALGSRVTGIVRGPDGNLWLSVNQTTGSVTSSRIVRFNPALAQPALALTVGVPSVRGRAVTVQLSCPAAAKQRCTGAAALLTSSKRTVIGKAAFSIPRGRRAAVVVQARGRKLIFPTLWVSARDAAGRSRQVTLEVKVPAA